LELRSISAVTRKIVRVEYKGLVFHEPLRFDLHGRMQRQRRDFVVTSPPQTLCFLCSLAKAFGVAFGKKTRKSTEGNEGNEGFYADDPN
jgi:hypothetical protein